MTRAASGIGPRLGAALVAVLAASAVAGPALAEPVRTEPGLAETGRTGTGRVDGPRFTDARIAKGTSSMVGSEGPVRVQFRDQFRVQFRDQFGDRFPPRFGERERGGRRDGRGERTDELDPGRGRAGAREGTKFCSVVLAGAWRDTIPVPPEWTVRDCYDFARALTAQNYQLACVFAEGGQAFSFGGTGNASGPLRQGLPSLPEPNCGWRLSARRGR